MLQTKYLKANVKNVQMLMGIPGLHNFEAEKLGDLLRLSRIRTYEHGEEIIKQGDEDPWLYFILEGSVKIIKDGHVLTVLAKAGEIFGEMRIIDGKSRTASVFAVDKTVCLAVDTSAKDRFHTEDEKTDFLLFLYKMLAEYTSARLRLTNNELIKCRKRLRQLSLEKK
jgi:CRP-like cAMP-binding protein